MAGLALVLALLYTTPSASEPIGIDASERSPAVAYVISPFGMSGEVRSSQLLEETARVMSRLTDLRLLSPEQAGMVPGVLQGCPSEHRLSCLLGHVREHVGAGVTDFYLVLINRQPQEDGRDRILINLLNLEDLRAAELAVLRDATDRMDQIEDLLFARALRSDPILLDSDDPRPLRDALEDAIRTSFSDRLRASGHWAAHGSVSFVTNCRGCTLTLDGATIGAVSPGAYLVSSVRSGTRTLALLRGARVLASSRVEVNPERTATSTLHVDENELEDGLPIRSVLLWSGVAVSALGGALIGYGAYRTVNNDLVCLLPDGMGCGNAPLNGAVPVGVGLAAFGSSGIVAGLRDGDDPWLWILGGALVGLAASGTTWLIGRAVAGPP